MRPLYRSRCLFPRHFSIVGLQVLDRLQQFLPQMEAANADLMQRAREDPESVDIEHLDHSAHGHYIEMVSIA